MINDYIPEQDHKVSHTKYRGRQTLQKKLKANSLFTENWPFKRDDLKSKRYMAQRLYKAEKKSWYVVA